MIAVSAPPSAAAIHPPRVRVLCFHGSGCDAAIFTSKGTACRPLPNPLVDFCKENDVELLSYQLPGRGMRGSAGFGSLKSTTAPVTAAADALSSPVGILETAAQVLEELRPVLEREASPVLHTTEIPLVIVGHSLGAYIAYEFACLMRKSNFPPPKQLFLACMLPPDFPREKRPWKQVNTLNSEELQQDMKLWGANDELFIPDMWKIYEPIIRSDLKMLDDYTFTEPRSPFYTISHHHDGGGSVAPHFSPGSLSTSSTPDARQQKLQQQQQQQHPRSSSPSGGRPTALPLSSSQTSIHSSNSSSSPKQSFHAPLGISTTVFYAKEDPRVTEESVEGWKKIIMGSNLFTSSPSGFGTAAKNTSAAFTVKQVPGNHMFLFDPVARKMFFDVVVEALERIIIDSEYGYC